VLNNELLFNKQISFFLLTKENSGTKILKQKISEMLVLFSSSEIYCFFLANLRKIAKIKYTRNTQQNKEMYDNLSLLTRVGNHKQLFYSTEQS